jgi:hypothetical protein
MACGCDDVALDRKVILAEGKLSEAATCKAWMLSRDDSVGREVIAKQMLAQAEE